MVDVYTKLPHSKKIHLCATSLFVRIGMFPIFLPALVCIHLGPNEVLQVVSVWSVQYFALCNTHS